MRFNNNGQLKKINNLLQYLAVPYALLPTTIKYTCQLTHYAQVSHLWTKDIDLMHQGTISHALLKIQTNCFLAHNYDENSTQFPNNIPKRHFMLTFCPNCITC